MKDEYNLLLKKATAKKSENEIFLKALSLKKSENIIPSLRESHTQVFKNIDCLSCANCCKTAPPLISQQDIKRISRHLYMTAKQFVRNYVIADYNGEMMFNVVPCRFLNSDNSCSIYEVRPEACRRYPHTDEKEYPKRISLNLANTLICPAAFKILEEVKKAIPLSP